MDERDLEAFLEFLLDPRAVPDERARAALRARAREWSARQREPVALPRKAERLVLGVDVSASHGLDLGDDLRPARIANVQLDNLGRFIRDTAPDAIAIDSPPTWARAGSQRRAE